ncbi:MAG: 16S rRNA (cytosine(1402)-N(4))-methyltransferase RsmH [Blastocatellia bacterium]
MQDRRPTELHKTVLLNETLDVLEPERRGVFVDATIGMGGHAEAILERSDKANVIGVDQDQEALAKASERLAGFGTRIKVRHGNFSSIGSILDEEGVNQVDGIIADLGVSSLQLDSESRGFSFRFEAPLDMRMDADSNGPTAADLLETLSEKEIANLIYENGEERASRKIAKWIVEKRESGQPIRTTTELAKLVERCVRRGPKDKIHPATRTFQALRIAVNDEIGILERFLIDSIDRLKKEGRLAVITFHSLEDRIVKQTFQRLSGKCFCPPRIPICVCGSAKTVDLLTKKPVIPSEQEARSNPRSRSAKLRAIRKLT